MQTFLLKTSHRSSSDVLVTWRMPPKKIIVVIVVHGKDVRIPWKSKDYLLNGFSVKTICFRKGLYSTIPGNYSFYGRLDFLCIWYLVHCITPSPGRIAWIPDMLEARIAL